MGEAAATIKNLAVKKGVKPESLQRQLKRKTGQHWPLETPLPDDFLQVLSGAQLEKENHLPVPVPKPAPQATIKAVQKPSGFRRIAPLIPLPLLGIPASYGVYHFALQFAPTAVAIIEACAFEATYIGLAAATTLGDKQKARARAVSIGAVWVSVLYNSISGALFVRPTLFTDLMENQGGAVIFWALSILHGAPLAVLAFLISDLHINEK